TPSVSTRRWGSFFFSWSKINMGGMRCWSNGVLECWSYAVTGGPILHHSTTPIIRFFSVRSHPPSLNLPVGPETRLFRRAIAQGMRKAVEKAKPERRDHRSGEAKDQPLPEGKPADQRLNLRIEQEQQG